MTVDEAYIAMLREYPDALTRHDVGAILHLEVHAVSRLIKSGKLYADRISGGRYIVPKIELVRYITGTGGKSDIKQY